MGKLASKLAFLFAGFVLAIATMAFAQSYDSEFGTGNVGAAYMVQPDGSTARFGGRTATINEGGDKAIMSYAQELPAGSILYRRNGKLHVLKNQMIDGKMCPEWEKTWTQ
ncbi:MAG TPA: hypothetical protein VI251_01370 [Pseudolabrys sp.]|jgi:hypothetical protein